MSEALGEVAERLGPVARVALPGAMLRLRTGEAEDAHEAVEATVDAMDGHDLGPGERADLALLVEHGIERAAADVDEQEVDSA